MTDLKRHFQQLRTWVDLEADAERERMAERRQRRSQTDAERSGETLLDLVIADYQIGLGGRHLLSFIKRNRTLDLPWNRFRVGSPVIVSVESGANEGSVFGVVSRRSNQVLQVAIQVWPEGDLFRIDLSADEVTRSRQLASMSNVEQARGPLARLRDVLLGEREPRFSEQRATVEPIPHHFNPSQRAAIEFALSATDIAIIHGPPGTGKTTTVVELVRQAVLRKEKVLVTAPSNPAVDNLLERLIHHDLRVVRIGHPARVLEVLQAHTLDSLVERDPDMEVCRDLLRQAEQLDRKAERFTRAKPVAGARKELRQESKLLREDARRIERLVINSYLDRADVVCATTMFDPEVLGDREFDLGVIDEACQSTEPGCWPVVVRARRIVLAGDHLQLPPTILSMEAARQGFAVSLMERLVNHYQSLVTKQLTVQYRMHNQIMRFSSERFYKGTLIADPEVAERRLDQLPGVVASALTATPLLFIDTAGAGWDEELEPDGESRQNPQEGTLLLSLVDELIACGVDPTCLAIIAPYMAQVRWIRKHCRHPTAEIDTVDGFQGREKEVVLISLVRSNATGEIGFLADIRRMNVALTRAKRKLIVIGDSATLGGHEFYKSLFEYFERCGMYQTVWEQ
jgi:superfamily I DNA and/or RNA helicase